MRKNKNDHSSQFLVLIQQWWCTVRCSSSTTQLSSLWPLTQRLQHSTPGVWGHSHVQSVSHFPFHPSTRLVWRLAASDEVGLFDLHHQTHRHSLTVGNPVASLDNSTATSKNRSYRNVTFGFLACCYILVCPTYSLIGQFGNSICFVAMKGASQKQKGKKREKEKKKQKSISVNNQFFYFL